MNKIRVKYFSEDYPKLEKIEKGDWIDLRVDSIIDLQPENETIENVSSLGIDYFNRKLREGTNLNYFKGDILLLGLGVAMELPEGYEAHVLPRSSTFKNTGFILTNGMGIIDGSYCGDDDEWCAMVIATRDGKLSRHDKLFQFRIIENQPKIELTEVEKLNNKNRGGYGTTGIK